MTTPHETPPSLTVVFVGQGYAAPAEELALPDGVHVIHCGGTPEHPVDKAVRHALERTRGYCLFLQGRAHISEGTLQAFLDATASGAQLLVGTQYVERPNNTSLVIHPLTRFGENDTVIDLATHPDSYPETLWGTALLIDDHTPQWQDGDTKDQGCRFLIKALHEQATLAPVPTAITTVEQGDNETEDQWQHINAYTELLEWRIPRWRQASKHTPQWVEHLIIQHLDQVMEKDRGLVFPARHLTVTERARIADMLATRLSEIPAECVQNFAAQPMSPNRRAVFQFACKTPQQIPIKALRLPDRTFREKRRVTTFLPQPIASKDWRVWVNDARIRNLELKLIDHRYFDRTFAVEHLMWLPRGYLDLTCRSSNGLLEIPVDGQKQRAQRPSPPRRWLKTLKRVLTGKKAADTRPPVPPQNEQWLYADRSFQARDNAEAFYEYAAAKVPQVRHLFALRRSSADWERLDERGFNLVDIDSPDFDAVWQNSDTLLLSDIGDPAFFARLQNATQPSQRVIFLQHGATLREMWRWMNGKRMDVMVTAIPEEAGLITQDHSCYTLTPREVWDTGFTRHDALLRRVNETRMKNADNPRLRVLLAPTWDYKLSQHLARATDDAHNLLSGFYAPWCELAYELQKQGVKVQIFAHPKLTESLSVSDLHAWGVAFVDSVDVPQSLAEATHVISDRSSILDEGMLVGAQGIIWDPTNAPDTEKHQETHALFGVPVAHSMQEAAALVAATAAHADASQRQPHPHVDGRACERLVQRLLDNSM